MHKVVCAACAVALALGISSAASAQVGVVVHRSTQTMDVLIDNVPTYTWLVSTGRAHLETPTGSFKVNWMARKHRSKHYHHASMPFTINFFEGDAIHATNSAAEVTRLGTPASHGCVRLAPENAELLFGLVQKDPDPTTITVED